LLKSPIGACPGAAIAVAGLTLWLPNERSGGVPQPVISL
jgi:hypothetical protein